MEIFGSFPHSHQIADCPHPESDQSSLFPLSHVLKIHFNIIPDQRLGLPSGFLAKTLQAPLLFPVRAIAPNHFILLDLDTRIVFGKKYIS